MIKKTELSKLLQLNWSTFVDVNLFMKQALKDVRDANLPHENRKIKSTLGSKITISSLEVNNDSSRLFNIIVDFIVPKENEISIGFLQYELSLDGSLNLIEIQGTRFLEDVKPL